MISSSCSHTENLFERFIIPVAHNVDRIKWKQLWSLSVSNHCQCTLSNTKSYRSTKISSSLFVEKNCMYEKSFMRSQSPENLYIKNIKAEQTFSAPYQRKTCQNILLFSLQKVLQLEQSFERFALKMNKTKGY